MDMILKVMMRDKIDHLGLFSGTYTRGGRGGAIGRGGMA